MNTVRSVKLIKNKERKDPKTPVTVELAVDPNTLSSTVRSWIVEFQGRDRDESLPAFDSLFKDASPSSTPGAESGSS